MNLLTCASQRASFRTLRSRSSVCCSMALRALSSGPTTAINWGRSSISSSARTAKTLNLARPITRPTFLSRPRIWFSRSRLILTSNARLASSALTEWLSRPLTRTSLNQPVCEAFWPFFNLQRFLVGAVPSGATAGPVPASAAALGHEGILGARLEHHVGAPPRLVVDQAPFVALADVVHGDQHIARSEYERIPVRGGELERARQRDHELRLGVRVPIIRGMRRRFLEMDGNHVGAIAFIDRAFEHMRCVVGSRVELERSQHFSAS